MSGDGGFLHVRANPGNRVLRKFIIDIRLSNEFPGKLMCFQIKNTKYQNPLSIKQNYNGHTYDSEIILAIQTVTRFHS